MKNFIKNNIVYLLAGTLILVGVGLSFNARRVMSNNGIIHIQSTNYPAQPTVTNPISKIAVQPSPSGGVCALSSYTNDMYIYNTAGMPQALVAIPSITPVDIASDTSSNCYVVGYTSDQYWLYKYNSSGNYINAIDIGTPSPTPAGPSESNYPNSVKVGLNNKAYVATSNAIKVFDVAIGSPAPTPQYTQTSGNEQFSLADVTMAINGNGDILVCRRSSNSCAWINEWATIQGSSFSILYGPSSYDRIAIDNAKNIYIANSQAHCIQKYDSSGQNPLGNMCGANYGGNNFYGPTDVGIDFGNNIVYSVDAGDSLVQKFDANSAFTEAWSFYGSGSPSPTVSASPSASPSVSPSPTASASPSASPSVSPSPTASASPSASPSPVPSGGDNGQILTYQDPNNQKTVVLILPNDVTDASVSGMKYPDLSKKDGNNQYPIGLTNFSFTTTPGATKSVVLYYDLPGDPAGYIARKFNPGSDSYTGVAGAVITRENYNGKSMIKLAYDITDGGPLDGDGQVNGIVTDPVGLATADSANLSNTGDSIYVYLIVISGLVLTGSLLLVRRIK